MIILIDENENKCAIRPEKISCLSIVLIKKWIPDLAKLVEVEYTEISLDNKKTILTKESLDSIMEKMVTYGK